MRSRTLLSFSLSALCAFVPAAPVQAAGPVFGSSAALNSTAGADSGVDFVPSLATDGAGVWVAVWRSDENHLGAGTDRDIFVARSTDAGANWTTAALLNSNATSDTRDDDAPFVATAAGTWLAVWDSEQNLAGAGTDADIFFARSVDGGATWSSVALLNTNAASDSGEDQAPTVLNVGAGLWVAVWQSSDALGATIGADFDILFSRSADDGLTWSAPAALNSAAATDTGSDSDPTLASDGVGNLVAVWQSAENIGGAGTDFDIFFARSANAGVSWSIQQPLNSNATSDSGNDRRPSIQTDAVTWVVAWESNDKLGNSIGTDSDILVSRSVDAGATWSAVAPLNTNAGSDSGEDRRVALVRGPSGPIVAVWESDEPVGSLQSDFDILMAQSFDDAQNWSAPDGLDPDAGSDVGADGNPAIATDGISFVAVWDSDDDKSGTIGGDSDILVSPSISPCPLTPLAGCSEPFVGNKGKLQLNDQIPSSKDKFSWKWNKGVATLTTDFGSPITTTEFTACMYDSSGPGDKLVLTAVMPAGGDCKGKPCWKTLSTKGFKYKDPLRTPNGITAVTLKSGADGKAKIVVKGKGVELDAPAPPLVLPVTMQISNSIGNCWSATYSAAQENISGSFKAKDD